MAWSQREKELDRAGCVHEKEKVQATRMAGVRCGIYRVGASWHRSMFVWKDQTFIPVNVRCENRRDIQVAWPK